MHGAEVGAASTDHYSFEGTLASFFQTFGFVFSVRSMMLLEPTLLALDVAIVRHGVTTEVHAFLQNCFHGFESQP